MNIKSTRQFICDKKVRLNAVPSELRDKIGDLLVKNYAKRGKTYSTATLGSLQYMSQERLHQPQAAPP